MFSNAVTLRYGTVVIAMALAAGLAATPAGGEIIDDSAPGAGIVSPGAYTAEDSAALLRVLEAPGRTPAADAMFGAAQEFGQVEGELRNDPQSVDTFALAPERERFEAWDQQDGSIVPEPATALLMGAGLAALAVFRGLRGRTGTE